MIVSNCKEPRVGNRRQRGPRTARLRGQGAMEPQVDIDQLISTSLSSLKEREVLSGLEHFEERISKYRLSYQRRSFSKLGSIDSNILDNADESGHAEENVLVEVKRCHRGGNLIERLVDENRERELVGGVVILRPHQTLSDDQRSIAQRYNLKIVQMTRESEGDSADNQMEDSMVGFDRCAHMLDNAVADVLATGESLRRSEAEVRLEQVSSEMLRPSGGFYNKAILKSKDESSPLLGMNSTSESYQAATNEGSPSLPTEARLASNIFQSQTQIISARDNPLSSERDIKLLKESKKVRKLTGTNRSLSKENRDLQEQLASSQKKIQTLNEQITQYQEKIQCEMQKSQQKRERLYQEHKNEMCEIHTSVNRTMQEQETKLKRMASKILMNEQQQRASSNLVSQLGSMSDLKESLLADDIDLDELNDLTLSSIESGEKNQANTCFREELIKLKINQFDVKSSEDVNFLLLDKLLIAQHATTSALLNSQLNLEGNFMNLKNSFISGGKLSLSRKGSHVAEQLFQAYAIQRIDDESEKIQINDLDSVLISIRLMEMKKMRGQKNVDRMLKLPFMTINLKTLEVFLEKDGKHQSASMYRLVPLQADEKRRNFNSRRMCGSQFDLEHYECLKNTEMDLRTPLKLFGLIWSTEVKGKKFAKPTVSEVIDGIKSLIFDKLDQMGYGPGDLKLFKSQYSVVFEQLWKRCGFEADGSSCEQYTDPESKAVRMILWLFTIEPSLYADLNEACIRMDVSKLRQLGAFARAIHLILNLAGLNRSKKVLYGVEEEYYPLGAFSQCFLLFRGAMMSTKSISNWADLVAREDVNFQGETMAKQFNLQGNTITFESFRMALSFTQVQKDGPALPFDFSGCYVENPDEQRSVMFVISVQNYNGFKCFSLNGEKYSAYPQENEVILLDGTQIVVMKVHETTINNPDNEFAHLNGQPLTVIHLFAVC